MEHRLDDQLYRYVLENQYEAFAQWTRDVGVWRAEVDEFPDACRELDEALKINDLINTGKAWLVHIVNSDYIVKQGDTVAIWESDKLPNTVRRNLGMLKLVKDRELISNVGIRVDESTYYVLGENNE